MQAHQLPIVEFGWIADQLVFIAQGKGPFTLLANSDEVNKQPVFPVHLLGGGTQPESVALSSIPVLANAVVNEKVIERQAVWVNILLWVVLLIGILIVGLMVCQLAKKMKMD